MAAWSYSSLNMFEQCPRKYLHVRLLKDVTDEPGQAALDGTRMHKAAEDYIRDNTPLPPDLDHLRPILDRLAVVPGEKLVEQRLAVTAGLEPCEFFDANVWARGVVDFAVVGRREALAVDYKTGRKKDDFDQLMLMAAMLMAKYEHIERVRAAYLWLKTQELTSAVYTRDDVRGIWVNFLPRVARIDIAAREQKYPCRPSPLCGWCPVNTCNFWVKR